MTKITETRISYKCDRCKDTMYLRGNTIEDLSYKLIYYGYDEAAHGGAEVVYSHLCKSCTEKFQHFLRNTERN